MAEKEKNHLRKYDKNIKIKATKLVCVEKNSTKEVAKKLGVPLKTMEKWITAYYRDSSVFTDPNKNQTNVVYGDRKRKNKTVA